MPSWAVHTPTHSAQHNLLQRLQVTSPEVCNTVSPTGSVRPLAERLQLKSMTFAEAWAQVARVQTERQTEQTQTDRQTYR